MSSPHHAADEAGTIALAPILRVARAEGAHLVTTSGERVLDLTGADGANLLGQGHLAAVAAQASQALALPLVAGSELRERATRRLAGLVPNLQRVVYAASASEGLEVAVRIARRWRGRSRLVAFRGGFHGKTYGTRALAGLPPFDRQTPPALPGTVLCRWGETAEVAAALDGDTAAVLLEPVQLQQGGRTATREWLKELESLCRARGAGLILDETECAGRVGAPLAAGLHGLAPHLVVAGRSLSGGVPGAAVLVDRGLSEIVAGAEHATPDAGSPLFLAAVEATLAALAEKAERGTSLGADLRRRLEAIRGVRTVRGLGLVLAVELDRPAAKVRDRLLADEKILVGLVVAEDVLRLTPPLTLTAAELDGFARALERTLARS